MRAVLDCNIYVSALIQSKGPSARILDALIQEKSFECILSPLILEEVRRVLRYPRLRRRIVLSPQEQEEFLNAFSILSLWVEDIPADHPIIHEDPSDDIYLQAAVEADADAIVSGDKHLLALRKYQGIPILTPQKFLKSLP